MSIALAQQTNYVYTPRATFNWTSRNLNYITISYYGNTAATSYTISSTNLTGQSYTTGDLSLNTLYTFVFTPYNIAGGVGTAKTIRLDTSPAISVANAVNTTGTSVTLQWLGTYSYVKVSGKITTDASYSDLSTNVTSTTYTHYNNIVGNTNYSFYITPYSGTGVAAAPSNTFFIKTGVQAAKNLAPAYIDSSSIAISFTEGANTYDSVYYTFRATDATASAGGGGGIFDASGPNSPVSVRNLSGNTSYSMYVITTLNNDATLSATSSAIVATTAVQPPNTVSTLFYDNSSITVSFVDGRNTYSTVYYSLNAIDTGSGVAISASGSTTPIAVTNLSGNTTYNLYVKNTLNGNVALSAVSLTPSTTTTKVQPVLTIGNTFIDGSSIGITFGEAKNTFLSRTYAITVTDISAAAIAALSSAQPNTTNMVYGLIGNTPYYFTVSTTLNGNSVLTATSSIYGSRTAVQCPTDVNIPFYDSSSIRLSFTVPSNRYDTMYYYSAYATDGIVTTDLSGTSSSGVFLFQDLSSNTTYTCYLRTYVTSRSSTISFTTLNRPKDMIIAGVLYT